MQTNQKDWLVRTKSRQILGPFTQRELFQELERNTFGAEDEIASAGKPWISAATLFNHDFDEVTRTSAQQNTGTLKLDKDSEENLTPSPTPTPTPTLTPVETYREVHPLSARDKLNQRWGSQPSPTAPLPSASTVPPRIFHRRAPWLTGIFLVLVVGLIVQMSLRKTTSTPVAVVTKLGSQSETPFVRTVYDLIARNEMDKALEQLTRYHQSNPKDLDYLIPYAGLLILENQSHEQARIQLDRVLTSSVGNSLKAKAHLWYGYSLLASEEDDLGESHFLEALQLSPNDPAARFNLGRTYIKQQKYAHALDYLQLAEVEVPDLWLIHIYKGRAKVALGRVDEARASFRLAIESSPDRWLSYIYYSLFLLGSKDSMEARLTMRTMLTRDPLFEFYSPAPWGFFQEDVDYREYLSAFSKVMAQARSDEQELGKTFISFLLNGNGPVENARLQAIAEHGGLLPKVLGLEALLKSEPKPEDLRRALVRLSGNLSEFGPYAYVVRAETKIRLGLLAEAQTDLSSALLAEPKSAAARLLQYKLYKIQNRKEEALREIQTILSYHPNYIPAIKATEEF
jgi:tetratricopeptide (TPR) repeat protein